MWSGKRRSKGCRKLTKANKQLPCQKWIIAYVSTQGVFKKLTRCKEWDSPLYWGWWRTLI